MSFGSFNNRLVIQSPMPASKKNESVMLASIIEEQFSAAGLRKYLKIIEETEKI
jgi:hypothetical protein